MDGLDKIPRSAPYIAASGATYTMAGVLPPPGKNA